MRVIGDCPIQITFRPEATQNGSVCFIIPSFDWFLPDPVNLAQLSPYDS